MKKTTHERKTLPLDKMQLLLRKFLKEVRHDFDLNTFELAQLSGYSVSKIEQMENSEKIHSFINKIAEFQRIADFRGIDADVFVSYLMGNKLDSTASVFMKEFASLVEFHMSPEDQRTFFTLLKENRFSSKTSELLKNFCEADDELQELHLKLKFLGPEGVKIFNRHIDWIFSSDSEEDDQ